MDNFSHPHTGSFNNSLWCQAVRQCADTIARNHSRLALLFLNTEKACLNRDHSQLWRTITDILIFLFSACRQENCPASSQAAKWNNSPLTFLVCRAVTCLINIWRSLDRNCASGASWNVRALHSASVRNLPIMLPICHSQQLWESVMIPFFSKISK